VNDSAHRDERLIAATLASGLLANSSKETTSRAQGTPAQAAVTIYFECLDALRVAQEKRAMRTLSKNAGGRRRKCIEVSTKAPHLAHWGKTYMASSRF